MKKLLLYHILFALLLITSCNIVSIGTTNDDQDLYREMLDKPENQYALTGSVAYTPKEFYRRLPANGETFNKYSLSAGTTGGISGSAKGRYYTKTVADKGDEPQQEFVAVDTLIAVTDTLYSVSAPVLMDDGSVCYSVSYEYSMYEYIDSLWIYNSQLGLIYSYYSYSDGLMGSDYTKSVLLSCSFATTSIGRLLNEYYAKRELPLIEL